MSTTINARREAITIALAAAEVSWATAGFLALGKSAARHQPLLVWLGFFVLLPVSGEKMHDTHKKLSARNIKTVFINIRFIFIS